MQTHLTSPPHRLCAGSNSDIFPPRLVFPLFLIDTLQAKVATQQDEPTPRGAHGFGYMDGRICVFGGYGPHGCPDEHGRTQEKPLNDLIFLQLRG